MSDEYIVDVFIPVAITVFADDAEQAASMAIEALDATTIHSQLDAIVNEDFSHDFVISDSPVQTEVDEG